MTNGTYLGPQPAAPFPDDVVASQDHALSLRAPIDGFIGGIDRVIRRVFLVGAGGSLLGLTPAQYLLDRLAVTPTVSINADEFFYRAPVSVREDALVVVLSGTGNTKETIRAAQWAQSRGAVVAGVTLKADGPLARALPTVFVARSGHGSQVTLQLLALALLQREGVDTAALHAALTALPDALLAAMTAFETTARSIAQTMKDVAATYVIASGPLFGAASTFTMCYLQEMQWLHAATINADEFFQGPFEVIDKDSKVVVFLGEDATRPMGERAIRFLSQYGGETIVVDGRSLDLPGIGDADRAYLLPMVFHALVARIAEHYASLRGYALEGRRYMWQFEY